MNLFFCCQKTFYLFSLVMTKNIKLRLIGLLSNDYQIKKYQMWPFTKET